MNLKEIQAPSMLRQQQEFHYSREGERIPAATLEALVFISESANISQYAFEL